MDGSAKEVLMKILSVLTIILSFGLAVRSAIAVSTQANTTQTISTSNAITPSGLVAGTHKRQDTTNAVS